MGAEKKFLCLVTNKNNNKDGCGIGISGCIFFICLSSDNIKGNNKPLVIMRKRKASLAPINEKGVGGGFRLWRQG